MKPIKFPEANAVYAENQQEYVALPSHRQKGDDFGIVTSCWKMDLRERIVALLTGEIWVSTMTFNMPLQPQNVMVDKPLFPSDEPSEPKTPVSIDDVNAILKKPTGGVDMSPINEELKK
jgi:hypothetical protein